MAAGMLLGACGSTKEQEATDQLDARLAELFPADKPGAAVLVMRGDSVLFDRGYGLADMETKAPIDGNTFFNIASVSKQFTAVAILQLANEGKLSIENPVAMYMPYPQSFWKEVRIKHLLSHSSGVPDERVGFTREERIHGTDSMSIAYMPYVKKLHFSPGTDYEYMNPTFVLCSKIIEQVSGEEFGEYMHKHIFMPAGMEETRYFDPAHEDLIPRMAHGYEYENGWQEYDYGEETFFATRGDGGIYTSTHEFVRWEAALKNSAEGSGLMVNGAWLKQAWEPRTKVSGSEWSDYQNRPNTWYGYGWFIEPATDSTKTVIYHTGDNGGFQILAARYPEDEGLVLVFSNRADWDRYGLMQEIEAIFGF